MLETLAFKSLYCNTVANLPLVINVLFTLLINQTSVFTPHWYSATVSLKTNPFIHFFMRLYFIAK